MLSSKEKYLNSNTKDIVQHHMFKKRKNEKRKTGNQMEKKLAQSHI